MDQLLPLTLVAAALLGGALLQALAAVDALYENFGADGVRNLMRNPERLTSVTAELDRRLGL